MDFQTASAEELTGIDPSLLTEQQLLEYTERLLTLGMVPNDDEDGGDEAAEVPAGAVQRSPDFVDAADLANVDSPQDAEDVLEAALLEQDLHAALREQDLETEELDLRSEFDIHAEAACKHWSQLAAEGMDIFSERAGAIAVADDLLGKHQNTALIVSDANVVQVVHWVGAVQAQRWGRAVRLDNRDRLIYAVAALVAKRSFAHCTIVHPNTGVRMMKHKAALRPSLPARMVKLKAKWQRMLDWEGFSPVGSCIVCERCVLGDLNAFQCVLCDCTFHRACSEQICEWAAAKSWPCGDLRPPNNSWVQQLMHQCQTFMVTLCDMCSAQLAGNHS